MTEQPTPRTEAGRRLLALMGVDPAHCESCAGDYALVAECEAQARTEALDVGLLRSVFIQLDLFVDVLPGSPIADRRADPFPAIAAEYQRILAAKETP